VLVVASSSDTETGYVGERFRQRGFMLDQVLRDRGELPTRVPAGTAALLLLGSEWSVASPADPLALEAECGLVRSAGDAGVPVLGLCYGAQILAHAHGGRVRAAAEPEVGLVLVETVDEQLVPPGPWSAFHVDVLEPPPGVEVVARNGCGVQAFVMPGVLGVQFHPEVLPQTLDDWAERFPELLRRSGLRPEEPGAQARRREAEARRNAHALVDAFLDRVAGLDVTAADPTAVS
jgi:GMP synthase-like glutamine amidotransferase